MKHKIKRIFHRIKGAIRTHLSYYRSYLKDYITLRSKSRPPYVFLFGVPFHPNLGDQAQTYCILQWIKKYLPRHRVFITMLTTADKMRFDLIRKFYRTGDIILCHSGYHITDLYREKDVYEMLAKMFPEEDIRILPQTIHFKNKDNALACADIFNKHGKCTLLCRDSLSYQTAKSLFSNCRLYLYPDIVTSLIGKFPVQYANNRNGVLFCMRNDKEAFYSKEQISDLMNTISEKYNTALSDTTVDKPVHYIANNRHQVLSETFTDMSKYRVVVTDRYHGTIFSLISNTPVIVVNSSDHKLSSGVKWFPEAFKKHVFFANDIAEIPALIDEIIKRVEADTLPPYFADKYYGRTLLETLNLSSYV